MLGPARPRRRCQTRAHRKPRFDHGEPIATIDTRPMAFVALFLSVFGIMWSASHIKAHAVMIDLPMVWGVPPDYAPPFVTVQIDDAGAVLFEGEALSLDQLSEKVQHESTDYAVILFQAAPNAAFETVLKALGEIRAAGIEPYEICFDPQELSAHRHFEPINYIQARTVIIEEERLQATVDIPASGCAQFYPPVPAEFY